MTKAQLDQLNIYLINAQSQLASVQGLLEQVSDELMKSDFQPEPEENT